MLIGDMKPTRWWRVIGPDGSLWAETSDEEDARGRARPGDRIQRLWSQSIEEWRDA